MNVNYVRPAMYLIVRNGVLQVNRKQKAKASIEICQYQSEGGITTTFKQRWRNLNMGEVRSRTHFVIPLSPKWGLNLSGHDSLWMFLCLSVLFPKQKSNFKNIFVVIWFVVEKQALGFCAWWVIVWGLWIAFVLHVLS